MRGLDNTRIEALSDGVFALAIALLLISSEVPSTFDELSVATLGLGDFVLAHGFAESLDGGTEVGADVAQVQCR